MTLLRVRTGPGDVVGGGASRYTRGLSMRPTTHPFSVRASEFL